MVRMYRYKYINEFYWNDNINYQHKFANCLYSSEYSFKINDAGQINCDHLKEQNY